MEFWFISTAIAVVVSGFLVFSLRSVKPASDLDDVELQFYKSQLSEIARDIERGIILEDEAERLRTEISRRILKLDARLPVLKVAKTSNWIAAISITTVLSVVGGGVGLYAYLGSPGYGDLSQANRIAHSEITRTTRPSLQEILKRLPGSPQNHPDKTYSKLIIELRNAVKTRPEDLEGNILLARIETSLQNYLAASKALRKVIEIKGVNATVEDHFDYDELLNLAAADRIALAKIIRQDRPSSQDIMDHLPASPKSQPNKTYSEMVEKLRANVKARPENPESNMLLARVEIGLLNYLAASKALRKVLEIKGPSATAEDYFGYAELLIFAAQQYVSPEAEQALSRVLERDIKFSAALYYVGRMMAQNDRPDRAFEIWRRLLVQTPQDSPWIEPIRAQIKNVALAAGVNDFELPTLKTPSPVAPITGPTQDDLKAAETMSNSDRMDMIRGMVARLLDRLATQGGSAQEWAKLIRSQVILENQDQALEIWENAKTVFAQYPNDLAIIATVAKETGVIK